MKFQVLVTLSAILLLAAPNVLASDPASDASESAPTFLDRNTDSRANDGSVSPPSFDTKDPELGNSDTESDYSSDDQAYSYKSDEQYDDYSDYDEENADESYADAEQL